MKLKSILLTALLTLSATFAHAGALDADYKAGEIQAEGIGFAETDDLGTYDFGGGARLTYWGWQNVGIGAELKTYNTDDAAIDLLGLNLAARLPVPKLGLAGVGRVGFDWNAEAGRHPNSRKDFTVYVGLGVEKRFSIGEIQNFTIGAEVRGVRAATRAPDEHLQLLISLGKAF